MRNSPSALALMEGLKECEANLSVHLHPSKATNAGDAILSELSSLLFTYNQTLDGFVLAYDPNITCHLSKILSGIHPLLGVTLKARLLLFNPKPGMQLEGQVVKITPNSIHVVVLGFASGLIADEDIRGECKCKCENGKDVFVSRIHKKHRIGVGTILRFTVKRFDGEVLHGSGSLGGEGTGCARWLDKNVEKWYQGESTRLVMKRKVNGEKLMKAENGLMDNVEVLMDEKLKKKRRKERS